jgi:flagellar FliL protein
MSEAPEKAGEAETPKKKGKAGLVVGLVAAAALGGGGFYAVSSGIVDPTALLGGGGGGHGSAGHGGEHGETVAALPADTAFVPMEPIAISLAPGSSARLLRFTGQLEVAPESAAEVAGLMPRVLDVLNTYLRAVEVRDLEQPASLVKLRAQMLRRVQVVTGEGKVRDLLITEFVLG